MPRVGRGSARLLCALTLLVGLVGMHGLASPAGQGCHGAAITPAQSRALAAHAMPTDAMPTDAMPARTGAAGPDAGPGSAVGAGSACVAVPPPGWGAPAGPQAAPAAFALRADAAGRPGTTERRADRAPPAGEARLRLVCVSRT